MTGNATGSTVAENLKKWTQLIRELRRCYLNGREDNGTGQDVKEGVHLSRAYFCHRWARKRNFRAV